MTSDSGADLRRPVYIAHPMNLCMLAQRQFTILPLACAPPLTTWRSDAEALQLEGMFATWSAQLAETPLNGFQCDMLRMQVESLHQLPGSQSTSPCLQCVSIIHGHFTPAVAL